MQRFNPDTEMFDRLPEEHDGSWKWIHRKTDKRHFIVHEVAIIQIRSSDVMVVSCSRETSSRVCEAAISLILVEL